jgi:hypothetical protein
MLTRSIDMNSEADKMALIRRYWMLNIPGCNIEYGSRTNVDRTFQVFLGVTLLCTVQVSLALLLDTHPSSAELEVALRQKQVAELVRSSPVVYLRHNTLGLKDY